MPQPQEFIALQVAEQQPLLTMIQKAIRTNDSSVSTVAELLMGKAMVA